MNTYLLSLKGSDKLIENPIIERKYPYKKYTKQYPRRYDNSVFEKLNQMKNDKKLQNNYEKWKNGINYNTNRKITIGGKIHHNLEYNFKIKGILFEELLNINQEVYLQETDKINRDIDIENDIIENYNKEVDDIIDKIKRLENWDDFVVFEGNNYGLVDKIKDNIHIENNCGGEMVYSRSETDYTFNDRPFCNYEDKETNYSIYKCSKCNYENKIFESSTGGGSQYISKTGFWWK